MVYNNGIIVPLASHPYLPISSVFPFVKSHACHPVGDAYHPWNAGRCAALRGTGTRHLVRIGSASRAAAGKWHRVAENGELMWLVDDYGLKSQSCLQCLHVGSLFNAQVTLKLF